eukprot:GHVQ01034703.1.p1 GENE.GHVQ01034703.1~~GHVQ01034703.1.p1  ORF type:complete len:354 (+),score=92.23 GHVQ01034703.1:467-1528(+)
MSSSATAATNSSSSGTNLRNVDKAKDDANNKVDDMTKGLNDLSISGTAVEGVDVMAALDPEARETVVALKELQSKCKAHLDDYEKELSLLKTKYEKLYKPLYLQRAERLRQGATGAAEENGTPSLPSFWLKCFKNSSTLAEMVEESDEPVLGYLMNISSEYLDEAHHNTGFNLVFTFAPNPYFEPLIIVKQYNMSVPEGDSQPVLNSTECTKISWNPGKDPTKERIERKQRNKRTKQTRTVTEDVDRESFFNFFNAQELPSEKELEDMPDQQVSELELLIEADYEMGITIRDKIIPQAISWFLGEVVDDDDEYDDDFDEEDDEEDADDDDEDESDESDEDSYPKRAQAGRRRR